ncbi:hypothetical protein PPTG_19571 [Phytophthora nicotianae INRA-310]|uniref:EF-hand domain-containing protein n=1 Tax=Phytophthora nicotianae (strain INRA-310) TaxID=761204 RepID=W2PCE9_PHYN3|nr:hypothetical protein PPTG_19571 [Phytophthora nicotianae INRA-310]ETM98516.1 hypothetical protein PPTG_19571 [Phytophthora nicotianae INRA-310]
MHSYLQQKRRELTTNIGNVFKGLQTSQGPDHEHEEAEQTANTKVHERKLKDKNATPKSKKSFGIYSVSEVMSVIRLFWSNGDGVMEFDEFTSFCVDAGMVASRTQGATLKHRYERDTKHALKTSAIAAPVSNSTSHAPTNTNSTPNTISTWIEKLKWSAGFRMFLVVENAARSVKIFTSEGKLVTEVNVTSEKQNQTNGAAVTPTPVVNNPINGMTNP